MVDITNPVDTQTWDHLATPPGTSAAEELAQLVPQATPVVKAQQLEQLGFLHIAIQQPLNGGARALRTGMHQEQQRGYP